jgi:restriction endonuclease S subunit
MKGSPLGWMDTPFGTLFDFKGGSQPPKATFSDHEKSGYTRLLQIRDFESDKKAVFIADHSRWPKCATDDIMVGRYGASVGKILTGKSGAYNVALVKMIFDRTFLEASWVKLFLQSDAFQEPLKRISRSAQNGFNKTDLENIAVPLAPLSEQRRIVAKINSLSAKSRRARDQLDHIPRLVEKYKQTILLAASLGELTHGWRLRHEGVEPASGTVNDIIKAPLRNGLSIRGKDDPPGFRSLRLSALRTHIVDMDDVRFLPIDAARASRYELHQGDVLVSRGNGTKAFVGIASIVPRVAQPTIFPDTAFRVRLDLKKALPEWLTSIWNSPLVRTQIEAVAKTTAGIWKISQADLAKIELLIPNIAEQFEIARLIENAFAWIDRLALQATSARKLIDQLDQAVLGKAFRGELVPQDPNDEPASVLLERIRVDRESSVVKAGAGTTAPQRRRRRKATSKS